jgi:hypothetical protein
MAEREDVGRGDEDNHFFDSRMQKITNPTLNMVTVLSPSLKLTLDIE